MRFLVFDFGVQSPTHTLDTIPQPLPLPYPPDCLLPPRCDASGLSWYQGFVGTDSGRSTAVFLSKFQRSSSVLTCWYGADVCTSFCPSAKNAVSQLLPLARVPIAAPVLRVWYGATLGDASDPELSAHRYLPAPIVLGMSDAVSSTDTDGRGTLMRCAILRQGARRTLCTELGMSAGTLTILANTFILVGKYLIAVGT
eukprot:25341-Rhodomonas_salina.1